MDALIFDLDGTLWDAMEPIYAAWEEALADSSLPHVTLTHAFLAGCMGKTPEEIARLAFPDAAEDLRLQEMAQLYARENAILRKRGGTVYPHVPEVLEQLSQRYALYIVSNSQDGYVQAFLSWSGLRCFRDIEMAGRTGLDKGDNIRLIMERNGVSRAVYIGDTQGDADAAAKAGIPLIFAAYGFGSVPDAKHVIHSFSELPETAAALLG